MVFGKVALINQNTRLVAVVEADGSCCIYKSYDYTKIDINDMLLSTSDKGDIFIENKTKRNYIQAQIVSRNLTYNQMLEIMNNNSPVL